MQKKENVLCELVITESVSGFMEHEELVGQLDALEWRELTAIAEVMVGVFERQLDVEQGSITIEKVISAGVEGLRQRIRIVQQGEATGARENLGGLATKVVQALRGNGDGRQRLLEESESGDPGISGAEEVSEFLVKKGGRPIRHPIQVVVGDHPMAELTGRFGAQPSDNVADDAPQVTRVVVDDVGFSNRRVKVFAVRNFCRTREALVLQYSEAALPELAAAIVSQRAIEIRYADKLDAQGKKFVELIEIIHENEGEYLLTLVEN
jgi:hypothetical protein